VREHEHPELPPCVHVSIVKRAVPDTPGAAQVFPRVLFLLEEMELQLEEAFITALAALAAQIDLG